jgi:hypothetical protein
LWVGLLAAGLPGCRSLPDHSALDAGAARAFVREQARAVRDLSAAVSLSIETAEFEGSLSGALLLEPPGRMRLRASKLMQDVFDLLVTPEELRLYWFRDRKLFRRRLARGEAGGAVAEGETGTLASASPQRNDGAEEASDGGRDPRSFVERLDGRVLRLALASFELPDAGEADEAAPGDRVIEESFVREGRSFVVRARLASGERLERRFDGRTLFLEEARLAAADGTLELRARYDDYDDFQERWLPTQMVLEDHAQDVRFEMSFDDVALNEGVLPGAFALELPPGAEVIEIGAADAAARGRESRTARAGGRS